MILTEKKMLVCPQHLPLLLQRHTHSFIQHLLLPGTVLGVKHTGVICVSEPEQKGLRESCYGVTPVIQCYKAQ